MKFLHLIIFLSLCVSSGAAFAGEEPAEGGEKKKPEVKADAGTAIVSVLQLPIVAGWQQSIKEQGVGVSMAVWGEDIEVIETHDCWGVDVGKTNNGVTHLWKHFCVARYGNDVWVRGLAIKDAPPAKHASESKSENPSEAPLQNPAPDDNASGEIYYKYEDWVAKCHPTNNSLGTC